jgi:hypothetical protein
VLDLAAALAALRTALEAAVQDPNEQHLRAAATLFESLWVAAGDAEPPSVDAYLEATVYDLAWQLRRRLGPAAPPWLVEALGKNAG